MRLTSHHEALEMQLEFVFVFVLNVRRRTVQLLIGPRNESRSHILPMGYDYWSWWWLVNDDVSFMTSYFRYCHEMIHSNKSQNSFASGCQLIDAGCMITYRSNYNTISDLNRSTHFTDLWLGFGSIFDQIMWRVSVCRSNRAKYRFIEWAVSPRYYLFTYIMITVNSSHYHPSEKFLIMHDS